MGRARYGRGDEGATDLPVSGRVSKSHPRVECYGEIDELSSFIGLCRSMLREDRDGDVDRALLTTQSHLFTIAAELAFGETSHIRIEPVSKREIEELEGIIERYEGELPELRRFIYPGGSTVASCLHVARSVARRVERRLVALSEREPVRGELIAYLNRLSSLLFVLARVMNRREGVPEGEWHGGG